MIAAIELTAAECLTRPLSDRYFSCSPFFSSGFGFAGFAGFGGLAPPACPWG
jgi:hypothetical protein